jgi:putative acetyltransferase
MRLMPLSVKIRAETPVDPQVIGAVTAAAFCNAPHASHTEQHIVNALRKAGKLAISLVAEEAGSVIGHLAISPVSISDDASRWFGLGPISVLPQHQRRGVGSQLVREGLRLLRERGASGCVVLGEPQYYSKFGFQPNPNLVLPGVSREYFQVISFELSTPSGIVRYHQAFNAQS